MSKELEEKRAQFEALWIEVRDLEEKDRNEKGFPKMKELEGTYWKYRNCYSCPSKESDYWWLHRYVKEVRPDGMLVLVEFQIDSYGEIRINTNRILPWEFPDVLGKQSTSQEWWDALAGVQSVVSVLECC